MSNCPKTCHRGGGHCPAEPPAVRGNSAAEVDIQKIAIGCPEVDSAAVEQTDITTIQVPAKPQGQPQPAAIAPLQKRKYKTNSVHPANDDEVPGPSQPAEELEPEIITESLSFDSLCSL